MSAIPVTFLEVHYDFWVAYLLAASALGLCLLLFAIWASKLGRVHGLSRTASCLANATSKSQGCAPGNCSSTSSPRVDLRCEERLQAGACKVILPGETPWKGCPMVRPAGGRAGPRSDCMPGHVRWPLHESYLADVDHLPSASPSSSFTSALASCITTLSRRQAKLILEAYPTT